MCHPLRKVEDKSQSRINIMTFVNAAILAVWPGEKSATINTMYLQKVIYTKLRQP